MNKIVIMQYTPRQQKGFTLVEIMIALLLGVFLTAGIGNIYIGSQQTNRLQANLSRIQENGRFALDYLAKEIRPAGFQGCPNLSSGSPENVIENSPSSFNLQSAMKGYEYDGSSISGYTPATNVLSGTDIVTVQRGGSCSASVTQSMDNKDDDITVADNCEFETDDFLVISDCLISDMIAASSVSSDSGEQTIVHDTSVNTTANVSKLYGTKTQVFRIYSREFYIKNNADGIPTLYQREIKEVGDIASPNEEELIEGVENLQIVYGVKSIFDGYAYVDADAISATQWKQVKSVRINLLMQSIDDNLTQVPKNIDFAGTTITPTDRRLRRVFSTTVFLRNRT